MLKKIIATSLLLSAINTHAIIPNIDMPNLGAEIKDNAIALMEHTEQMTIDEVSDALDEHLNNLYMDTDNNATTNKIARTINASENMSNNTETVNTLATKGSCQIITLSSLAKSIEKNNDCAKKEIRAKKIEHLSLTPEELKEKQHVIIEDTIMAVDSSDDLLTILDTDLLMSSTEYSIANPQMQKILEDMIMVAIPPYKIKRKGGEISIKSVTEMEKAIKQDMLNSVITNVSQKRYSSSYFAPSSELSVLEGFVNSYNSDTKGINHNENAQTIGQQFSDFLSEIVNGTDTQDTALERHSFTIKTFEAKIELERYKESLRAEILLSLKLLNKIN